MTHGTLCVNKSFWYLIHFIWENNLWRYSNIDEQPGELYVQGVSRNLEYLACLEPSEAHETLSVFLTMDSNNAEQICHLHEKGITFAGQICSSSLSHDESWNAFETTILKTLEYPIEAINFTEQQLDYIMSPILQSTLPKSGIVHTFSRSILYASKNSLDWEYSTHTIISTSNIYTPASNRLSQNPSPRTSFAPTQSNYALNYP